MPGLKLAAGSEHPELFARGGLSTLGDLVCNFPNRSIFRGPCAGSPRKIPWTSPPQGHRNDPSSGGGSKRARRSTPGSKFDEPHRKSLAAAKPVPLNLPGLHRPPHPVRKPRTGRRLGVRFPQPGANHRFALPTLKILSPLAFTRQPDAKNLAGRQVFRRPVPTIGSRRCPPACDPTPR